MFSQIPKVNSVILSISIVLLRKRESLFLDASRDNNGPVRPPSSNVTNGARKIKVIFNPPDTFVATFSQGVTKTIKVIFAVRCQNNVNDDDKRATSSSVLGGDATSVTIRLKLSGSYDCKCIITPRYPDLSQKSFVRYISASS